MGREAICTCDWNGETARVKALLEPPEMILRGELRSASSLREDEAGKRAAGGDLSLQGLARTTLDSALGGRLASKWAEAILKPPPTLAMKLGILPGIEGRLVGKIDDKALSDALSEAQVVSRGAMQLIVARANTAAELT